MRHSAIEVMDGKTIRSLRSAVANEKEGREGMALGEYIAGMGFSNDERMKLHTLIV